MHRNRQPVGAFGTLFHLPRSVAGSATPGSRRSAGCHRGAIATPSRCVGSTQSHRSGSLRVDVRRGPRVCRSQQLPADAVRRRNGRREPNCPLDSRMTIGFSRHCWSAIGTTKTKHYSFTISLSFKDSAPKVGIVKHDIRSDFVGNTIGTGPSVARSAISLLGLDPSPGERKFNGKVDTDFEVTQVPQPLIFTPNTFKQPATYIVTLLNIFIAQRQLT